MSFENPLSILFNAAGQELAVSASQILDPSGSQPGIVVAGSGSDGSVHFMKVATDGAVFITGSVAATATFPANTPVSQGNPGAIGDSWNVKITDGTKVLGTGSSAPLWVTGTVFTSNGGPNGSNGNPIFVTGSFAVTFNPNPTATVTEIPSATSATTLQAANAARRGLTIYNASTKNLYVKLGSAAATNSFTVKMSSNGYYEVPSDYTGIVTGIWDTANGNAYVTEIID